MPDTMCLLLLVSTVSIKTTVLSQMKASMRDKPIQS